MILNGFLSLIVVAAASIREHTFSIDKTSRFAVLSAFCELQIRFALMGNFYVISCCLPFFSTVRGRESPSIVLLRLSKCDKALGEDFFLSVTHQKLSEILIKRDEENSSQGICERRTSGNEDFYYS